jgi:ATP synthase regulation protein NCA2
MLAAFERDHPELVASAGNTPTVQAAAAAANSSAAPLTAITAPVARVPADTDAINRGMQAVMQCYEAELRSPIRNTVAGDLARTLLIQVCADPPWLLPFIFPAGAASYAPMHERLQRVGRCWPGGCVLGHLILWLSVHRCSSGTLFVQPSTQSDIFPSHLTDHSGSYNTIYNTVVVTLCAARADTAPQAGHRGSNAGVGPDPARK